MKPRPWFFDRSPHGAQRARRGLALAVVCFGLASGVQAQDVRFDHLTDRDGLSHTTVWDIHQDRHGFLWFGTQDGLDRYDGYEFVGHRNDPSNEHSLSHNDVLEIYEDRQGFLWLETRVGLERFDPVTQRFQQFELAQDSSEPVRIHHFFEDRSDTLWIASSAGLHRFDRGQGTFTQRRHDPDDPDSPSGLPGAAAHHLAEDLEGRLWVATSHGLTRLDTDRRTASHYHPDPEDPQSLADEWVGDVLVDADGTLWVGTGQGVDRWEPGSGFIHQRYAPGTQHTLGDAWSGGFHLDAQGELWTLTGHGLARLDRQRQVFELYEQCVEGTRCSTQNQFIEIVEDREGNLWIATRNDGLYRLGRGQTRFDVFRSDPRDPTTLGENQTRALFEDRSGILWVGTYAGADRYDPQRAKITTLDSRPERGGLSEDSIWAIHETRDTNLWVGTYEKGLNRIDRRTGTVRHYLPAPEGSNGLGHVTVTSLAEDRDGHLWIGTYVGLDRLDPDSDRFTPWRPDPEVPGSLPQAPVYGLLFDSRGWLWVGQNSVVSVLDVHGDSGGEFVPLHHDPSDPDSLVPGQFYNLFEDRDGRIWAASLAGGVSRLTPGESPGTVTDSTVTDSTVTKVFNLRHDPDNPQSLSSNETGPIHQDASGFFWIGTYGAGLNRYDPESHTFRHYTERDGLPSNSVLGILSDTRDRLWLSTYRGLSRFDPATETFQNFDVADGLQGNVYSSASQFQSPSGELFFGGVNGLDAFFPEDIVPDPFVPPVVFTDFQLFYDSARLRRDDPDSPLEQPIQDTDALVLDHRQYNFAVEFAALHFAAPLENRYAYRLEGFDDDWVEVGADERVARYSNLSPGHYTLRVRGSNDDGIWNEAGTALAITVLPAPWRTWWAYTGYVLAMAGLVFVVVRRQQAKLVREREINAQLREVDRLKDEFLANTSHELRTPLYGITGLAESLSDGLETLTPEAIRANLTMIVSSGRRLNGLVDDILDVSKSNRKKIEIRPRPVELHALGDVVTTLLQPLAKAKGLTLGNSIDPNLPAALGDENRLQQILLNLMGNAIKFTDTGSVDLSAQLDESAQPEEAMIHVRVSDTGIGIPEEDQVRIFEAFEQVDASSERLQGGTGLGLAVTRQLVELHGGELRVTSTLGEGSTFSFTLPAAQHAQDGEASEPATLPTLLSDAESMPDPHLSIRQMETKARTLAKSHGGGDDRPRARLLLVDDEPINLQVLANYLAPEGYDLTLANSGAEALEHWRQEPFDLIILDVMMPRLSGYAVCRQIRETHSRDELPVLFLTAKTRVADLLTGFTEGANDYLTKPIAKRELLARVATHLEVLVAHRSRRQEMETLQGLLPICSSCKKVRDDQGYWRDVEDYLYSQSGTLLSHSLCAPCAQNLYPQLDLDNDED